MFFVGKISMFQGCSQHPCFKEAKWPEKSLEKSVRITGTPWKISQGAETVTCPAKCSLRFACETNRRHGQCIVVVQPW